MLSLSVFVHFIVLFLLSLSVVLSFQSSCKEGDLIRYVAGNGTNTRTCLNSSEPRANPCRTLNFALLEDDSDGTIVPDDCEPSVTPDNLCIRLEDGIHRLTGEAQATRVTNLTIEAVNPHEAVIRCREFPNNTPKQWDNLVFFCSSNIILEGVVLEECGPVTTGIYTSRSDGILMLNSIFRNITGVALEFFESNNIILRNCTFEANVNQITHRHAQFNHSTIKLDDLDELALSGGGLNILAKNLSSLTALIEGCRFTRNGVIFDSKTSRRPPLFQVDGHGGGAYIRLSAVSNSNVTFSNTVFDSNSAQIDGGAIYISMSNGASHNYIRFDNCQFYNNSVTDTSGGAISVVLYNSTKQNEVLVQDCVFEENSATGGGAIGFVIYDIGGLPYNHTVSVENSTFKRNRAVTEGSAIGTYGLIHVDEASFKIQIQNCIFEDNEINGINTDSVAPAKAAVSSFRVPIQFIGTNRFYRNIGGGVSIVESLITVAENSYLTFESNSANFGGGLHLVGTCLLVVHSGANVNFVGNTAHVFGGGIMVNSPVVNYTTDFLNRFCFIRYSNPDVPPQNWENVSISFINNTAKVGGAALYGSDLRRCSWLNVSVDDSMDHTIFTPPKDLSVPFIFQGNHLERNEDSDQIINVNMSLGTNPVKVILAFGNNFTDTEHRLQPGETFSIHVFNEDQLGNSRRGIMCIEFSAMNLTLFNINECTRYAVGDASETITFKVPEIRPGLMENRRSIPAKVTFRLPLYAGEQSVLHFNLTGCHPGYKLHDGMCVCNSTDTDVIHCDSNSRYIYVREGTYAHFEEFQERTFILYDGIPTSLLNCNRKGQLPGCMVKFDDPYNQCTNGRTGFLCGNCPYHYVTLDLQSCGPGTDCTPGVAVFVIWTLAVVLGAVLILAFNVELPAELRAVLFYVQVIGLVFGPYSSLLDNNLKTMGNFLSLLTFGLPIPLCLAKDLPTFAVALLGFVTPLLIFSIAVLYAICARFNSTISSRGAIHGLSFLSLFIYKYLSDVAFTMVSCRRTEKADYYEKFVFLYNGTQSCLSSEYLPFFVLAVLIILTVILPAPCVLCALTARRWTKFDLYHFIDQITKDVRPKREWYAGWDIGRRLMFIIIFFGGVYADSSVRLLANVLAAAFVLLVHLLTKPFRKDHNNIIETVILLNLVIVTVSYLEPPAGEFHKVLVVAVTILPYLFALGFLVMKAGKKIQHKLCASFSFQTLVPNFIHRLLRKSKSDERPETSGLAENLLINKSSTHGAENDKDHSESQSRELGRRSLRVIQSVSEGSKQSGSKKHASASAVGPEDISFSRDINLFEESMN